MEYYRQQISHHSFGKAKTKLFFRKKSLIGVGGVFHSMPLISLKPVFWPWKAGFCLLRVGRGRRGEGVTDLAFFLKKTKTFFLPRKKKQFYFKSVCRQSHFHFQLLLQSPLNMQKGKLRRFRGFTMSWKSQNQSLLEKTKFWEENVKQEEEGAEGGLKALSTKQYTLNNDDEKGQLVIDAFHAIMKAKLIDRLPVEEMWLPQYLLTSLLGQSSVSLLEIKHVLSSAEIFCLSSPSLVKSAPRIGIGRPSAAWTAREMTMTWKNRKSIFENLVPRWRAWRQWPFLDYLKLQEFEQVWSKSIDSNNWW